MRQPLPVPPSPIAHFAAHPAVLPAIRAACVNLVVWRRGHAPAAAPDLLRAIPFSVRSEGRPREAARAALRACPARMPRAPQAMLVAMARRFAQATGTKHIVLRVDGVADDACRKFHADAVGIRLLWTWVGRGTELIPGGKGRIRRLRAGDVALLKGEAWPGNRGRGAIHRSPPVAHLPRRLRRRVLVVMDTLAED